MGSQEKAKSSKYLSLGSRDYKTNKKTDHWKDIQAMTNQEFAACLQQAKKRDKSTPSPVEEQSDASVAAFVN